jgi:hypothetical protein
MKLNSLSLKTLSTAAALAASLSVPISAFSAPAEARDTFSDTWVATDGLGRRLPLGEDVPPPRAGKTVGMFYFLWLGQHGQQGPFDITKILAADPKAMENPQHPAWGPIHVPHHWGESIFNYYVSEDEGVLAKHAQMLSDAGVDMVVFDVTNQLTYPRSWQALCRVWDRLRKQGNRTPQIAFLAPFWSPNKVVRELFHDLYSPGLYPDLWFPWEGKPLILADPTLLGGTTGNSEHDGAIELHASQTLGQTFEAEQPFSAVGGSFATWKSAGAGMRLSLYRESADRQRVLSRTFENVPDNSWQFLEPKEPLPPGKYSLEMSDPAGHIGWWSHSKDLLSKGQALVNGTPIGGDRTLRLRIQDEELARIHSFFTFRKPQPDYFVGPTGPNQWAWLEVHPQHVFTNTAGVAEQMAVGVAQNALDGRLSVLSNPRAHGRSFHNGAQPGPEGQDFTGRNFTEQWKRALEVDPAFLFVTGWNEWIAGRFTTNSGFYGDAPVCFVDQFNREYSRDIEPMEGGHGDVFYYQFVANVRRYKGARPVEAIKPQRIQIDGKFADWAKVAPEFRDTLGDPVRRDHLGWDGKTRYRNQTGRNDIVAAKVSFDAKAAYFYVRTQDPLTPATDPNWMLLFLDVDGNSTNHWLGYDFVVNRTAPRAGKAVVEKQTERGYSWNAAKEISFRQAGSEMEIAIPWRALGLQAPPPELHFKWADSIQQTGDWSDFTLNGDVAPNDRFNYRAIFR